MKFEELYKQANDSIHADRKIIDTLFETKRNYNFHTLSLCAAAFVVVFALSVLPEFHTGNTHQQKIAYSGKKNTHSDTKGSISSAESATDSAVSHTGMAISDTAESNMDISEISYSDYVAYLGWDILECNLSLPEHMELSVPETVQIMRDKESNEFIDDTAIFSFTNTDNPYSYMSVSVTKISNNINRDGYKSYFTVNETEVFLKENETFTEAYTKHNDVWMYITSIDVSKGEFDAFLKSLIN